ncbi:hypothetical protein [Streptomyces sp. NPDC059003]|uniref:hypothetical protein n=1 Tax=Streptomyces sp. NPDC059003 TaxID=3346691 RepID=UPI003681719D
MDLAVIADEAGVTIDSLVGIRGYALFRKRLRSRIARMYWWSQGIGRHRCPEDCS